jgi:thiol-disulfide isomerase/thioredoxin
MFARYYQHNKRVVCVLLSMFFWALNAPSLATELASPDISKVELKDMMGKRHVLGQYQGKWLVINYWATWCPPCLEEMPDLVNLYDARKHKDLMVIGVAFEYESAKAVSTFVDDMLVSYPIVLGDAAIAKQLGKAEVMPTTFIYNPAGKLVKVKRGLISRATIEQTMATPAN